jgi:aminoglycoside phosphotransferase (APT) family kinase protein
LTYKARMQSEGGGRAIVIKAAPPGLQPVRNRDVLRQARILEVLAGTGVAVPEVLGEDPGEPPEIPPLFVMSYVEGESYEPAFSALSTEATKDQIKSRAYAAARMAALLHNLDVDDSRLAGESVVEPEDEIARWARAFGSVEDDLRTGADDVRDRLAAAVPAALAPSILHGDWRLGNMQCEGDSIGAVIDCESGR